MWNPGFPGGSDGKASVYNVGDLGLIPGSGRSPGEGNGNPLRYYCLDNPTDGGAWKATVHGIAKCWTQLSNFTFTLWIHRSCRYRRIFTGIYNIGAKGSKKLSIKDRFLFYLLALKFILWGKKKTKRKPLY